MKKNDIILPDTNTILRYLLNDIPEQFKKASDFFEKVRSGSEKIIFLESVIVECIYILIKFYKTPKKEGADTLISLLQYKGVINPDKSAIIDALRIYSENNIDMVDCMLLAKSHHENIKLSTFDKALEKYYQKGTTSA